MTRFASFWVEEGKIVAPVDVMRFDDSVFRLLGDQLVGLTAERELLVNGDTYRERNVEQHAAARRGGARYGVYAIASAPRSATGAAKRKRARHQPAPWYQPLGIAESSFRV